MRNIALSAVIIITLAGLAVAEDMPTVRLTAADSESVSVQLVEHPVAESKRSVHFVVLRINEAEVVARFQGLVDSGAMTAETARKKLPDAILNECVILLHRARRAAQEAEKAADLAAAKARRQAELDKEFEELEKARPRGDDTDIKNAVTPKSERSKE